MICAARTVVSLAILKFEYFLGQRAGLEYESLSDILNCLKSKAAGTLARLAGKHGFNALVFNQMALLP